MIGLMSRLVALALFAAMLAFTARQVSIALGPVSISEKYRVATGPVEPVDGGDKALLIDVHRPALAAYPHTTSRPVFFEDRRYPEREVAAKPAPPPPQAVAVAVEPVQIKGLTLMGLQLGAGGSRALIDAAASKPVWIKVGERVQAWTVQSIHGDHVLLYSGDQKARLDMYSLSTPN